MHITALKVIAKREVSSRNVGSYDPLKVKDMARTMSDYLHNKQTLILSSLVKPLIKPPLVKPLINPPLSLELQRVDTT